MDLSLLGGTVILTGIHIENSNHYKEEDFVHIRETWWKIEIGEFEDLDDCCR